MDTKQIRDTIANYGPFESYDRILGHLKNTLNLTKYKSGQKLIIRQIIDKLRTRSDNKSKRDYFDLTLTERLKDIIVAQLPNQPDDTIKYDIISQKGLVWLCQYVGYCNYTKRKTWYVDRRYLVGYDRESGWWVRQVTKHDNTVNVALENLKPADVRKAEKENRKVYRQGDVYAIEMTRKPKHYNLLPHSHELEKYDDYLVLSHSEHEKLFLNGLKWQFFTQKRVQMATD